MSIEIINIDNKKSLLSRRWKLCNFDERNIIYFSQTFNLKYIVSKLLSIRGVDKDYIENFLNPTINNDILVLSIRVKGTGDYLPEYAGNLDIINCAAIEISKNLLMI